MLTFVLSKNVTDCIKMLIPEKLIKKLERTKTRRKFKDFESKLIPFVISNSPALKPWASR